MANPHPVLRYADVLVCLVLAVASLVTSGLVNIHSVSWLIGVYTCLGLGIASRRQNLKQPVFVAYQLYLVAMGLFLSVVWLLHVSVPGPDPQSSKHLITIWAQILRIGTIFLPACYLHFTLKFIESQSRALKAVDYGGFVIGLILFVTNIVGSFAIDYRWTGRTWAPIMGGSYVYFTYYTLTYISLSLLIGVLGLRNIQSEQRRAQVFFFLCGSIPLWLAILTNFLLSFGISIYPTGGLFFILHMGVMAYAVFKRRVLDVSIALRRGLAYACVSLTIGMMFGAIQWTLSAFTTGVSSAGIISCLMVMFVSGFIYSPLLAIIQERIDRFFMRRSISRQFLLEQLIRESASTLQLGAVVKALSEFLTKTMQPTTTAVYLSNHSKQCVLYSVQTQQEFHLESWPTGKVLTPNDNHCWERAVRIESLNQDSIEPLKMVEGNESLFIPILQGSERLGCVILGPKLADEQYTDDDILLVESAIAHSKVALANSRAFAAVDHLRLVMTHILQGLTSGVLVVSKHHVVSQTNESALRMVSCKGETHTLRQLCAGRPALLSEIALAIEDERPRVNLELREAESVILLNVNRLGYFEDDHWFLVVMNDITEYKQLELMAREREGLAKVGEMILSINHEVKSVLQPINYQVNLLRRIQIQDDGYRHAMKVIPDRLCALDQLLDNLRDLARPIELRIRPVRVFSLLEAVWLDLKTMPDSEGVDYVIQCDESIRTAADGHWLRQVFYNLLRNAIESTVGRQVRRITVRVSKKDESVCMQFSDTGCGIPENLKSKLFEPFFSTKGKAGTGLGLSISKKIVDSHGGHINVRSVSGEGTAFTIVLPVAPENNLTETSLRNVPLEDVAT